MIRVAPGQVTATCVARLPDALRWRGEPAAWTRMTRPGMALHSFLEGPCIDGDRLLVADVPHGRVFAIRGDDWSIAYAYPGEPHAIRRLDATGFVVADHRLGLLRVDAASGAVETLCAAEHFHGLSDLAVTRDGAVWFTDPGRSSLSERCGRLWRRAPDGALRCVLEGLAYPNGVALDPDERFVHVACTRMNAVLRLATTGAEEPPMSGVFLHLSGGLGPDGLAIDAQGRIAVAQAQAGRAYLFDRIGDPLAEVRTAGAWTTAVAFAPDGALLIVEAEEGAIWRVSGEVIEAL